ncbi:MAG: single-stranded DNA-binding protein [Cyanobacterium sp. T60_A2020_053]|nr:single-stranded DNA-binding protein [Cyanobacterium sp. T60_A2020_053]
MNSCVLMAKIIRSPQLRYIQDSQLPIAEMMVEFDSISPNNPPCTMKVVAWGTLATEVEQTYKEGNEVILTGRLKMALLEKQGYKEKIAEMTISHIYPVSTDNPTPPPNNVISLNTSYSDDGGSLEPDYSDSEEMISENNLDNIPF